MPEAAVDRYPRCPRCEAQGEDAPRLTVYCSRVRGNQRVRYLGCPKCGFRPDDNKRIVPLIFAPSRS